MENKTQGYTTSEQVRIAALLAVGLGPFIAVGSMIVGLAGFGLGGAVGGVIGVLVGMSIPQEEAKRYQEGIRKAASLLPTQGNRPATSDSGERHARTAGPQSIAAVAKPYDPGRAA